MARFFVGRRARKKGNMVMTLCDTCVQPFFDDRNYTVKIVHPDCPTREKEKGDGECFICGRRGCDYDVEKLKK